MNSLEGEFGTSTVTHVSAQPDAPSLPPPVFKAPLGKPKKKKKKKANSGRRSSKLAMGYGSILNKLEGEFG